MPAATSKSTTGVPTLPVAPVTRTGARVIGVRTDLSEDLVRLDAAMLDRITDVPVDSPRFRHGGARVEVSTVLVVDAVFPCHRVGKRVQHR